MIHERLKKILDKNEFDLAHELIVENEDSVSNIETMLMCGEVCSKLQKMGEAINWYNKILEIDPDHQQAQTQLNMLNSIMNFRYKDLYNP